MDPWPMLIRMVHVRPSLGPIPPASPTPHTHSRALRWPPCFGIHLPACRQSGSRIPPTPSVRGRLDHWRDRDRQGHVSHDYRARRAATGLLRTPTVSVASSYHSGTAWPGLAKAPASRLPRPPLLPAESLPRVLPRPPSARPYADGYLSVGHGSLSDSIWPLFA